MARVLIIDDSAVVREMLREILADDPKIEVVGTAPDPLVAREMIKALDPDVLTLDIEMPRMDGLDFLGRLMRLRPMPVVMVSSHVQPGATMTIRALEMGAVDVVGKPSEGCNKSLLDLGPEIIEKVKAAARVSFEHFTPVQPDLGAIGATDMKPKFKSNRLIGIGASTGGVQAINAILPELPENCPPVLVVQHMPPGFTRSFAERLDRGAAIKVLEAEHGMPVLAGHAYVAPGGQHLEVRRSGGTITCHLEPGLETDKHAPSVDRLFRSLALVGRHSAIGVVLTGMGSDGALGLLEMRKAGAATACQDETTSMIYGMPKVAAQIGAAQHKIPLKRIAQYIISEALKPVTRPARAAAIPA
jgi:two-component system chemotaxis response regulator CheB